jgi:tRNA threonylcarbamoyladenosine biosynthesis protein TsaE
VTFPLEHLEDYLPLAQSILDTHSDLVILSGPLGAGKTTLTQVIAKTLGSEATVSSPTYTLIHEYPTTQGLLVHIDAYRLPAVEALLELGLDDYLERARLVVVEWGAGLLKYYPEALEVRLFFLEETRKAQMITH